MRLDFEAIKKVPVVQVCAKFGIRLRYRGEYANGPCPLPTHPAGDKNNKSFSVHVPSNTWRCFHTGCSAVHGCGDKPGDVINFVQVKERCAGQKEPAELLATWYGLNGNKNGSHNGSRRPEKAESQPPHKDSSNSSESAKESKRTGYLHEVSTWFDELIIMAEDENDTVFWKRVKNGVIKEVKRSYVNGQREEQNLPPLPRVY
jgi:hypothetical protein